MGTDLGLKNVEYTERLKHTSIYPVGDDENSADLCEASFKMQKMLKLWLSWG